jgi:large subunit ribosomal protein L17
MRHGKKFNHLGRQASHRKAMLANMSCSLIEHKRINTTVAKAKALKKFIEPLLTKSKVDSTHSRRTIFSYLNSKEAVTELFREVAPKINDRPGGYLRVIRTENRLGDNAEMCMVELVDFNTLYTKEKSGAAKKTRTRRAGTTAKKADTPAAPAAEVTETPAAEAVAAAPVVAEAPAAPVAEATEEATAEEQAPEQNNAPAEEAGSDEEKKTEE